MAKLKPWYHVVTPREDLRDNRPLDASEFAVHLEHVRVGRAHDDYTKPQRFFDRTYMTRALVELCAQAVRRLSGIKVETSAVFNMATQFGGGKTHALTALYHLAQGGDAAKNWKGVDTILRTAAISTWPKANWAIFVGTEFDALTGRGGDGEPVRKTPWGDIAWQLGGERSYEAVEQHDQKLIAPGGDVIRQMLPERPCVVLIDELLNYIGRGRKLGLRDELYAFLQSLAEEARARDNMVLCVSLPGSITTEMTPEDTEDFERFKHLLNRLGRAIMMSAETEAAEIIRRRLFEWTGPSEDARRVASQYADWATENAPSLSGIDASNARDVFLASYPFHPAVLSVFERKWQSLPRFQRTRGILRLLALWVAHNFQEEHRRSGGGGEHLITLGSAPVENPTFRAAMFEQLGSSDLEGPVTTDIAGKADAWATRLDREAPEAIKKLRLHQKAATAILFESNGGQTRARASMPEIKAAVGGPEVLLPEVDHVLEELARSCYYLTQDGNYYRFSLSPNLNKILTDRRAGVSDSAIEDRLKQEIESQFKQGPRGIDLDRRYWPADTRAVPDRPELTLVIFGSDMPVDAASTRPWMEKIVRECGSSGRTFKAALIFVVPESASTLKAAVRDLLAWEDIEDDAETIQRLDASQKRQLSIGAGRAKSDLREAIWRSYRHVFLLDKNGKLKETDLGQVTSSMATSTVELIINRLVKDDEISDTAVGANRLLKYWPPALDRWSTKGVRDAFYSSPAFPRLLRADSVKRTIADGVTQGLVGYARGTVGGTLRLERFKESLSEAEVEIADDVFILKAEDAQKLLEPPRLAKIRIEPPSVSIAVGEKASFRASGLDQYGQPFPLERVTWEATGGAITEAGEFTAREEAGAFSVRARDDGVEGSAQVRISSKRPERPGEGITGGVEVGERLLRWSGMVPPQKWMNFYTKVLSKYVSNDRLRLKVEFEVPVPEAEAPNREQDTRSALRELGLGNDASAT